MGSHIRGGGLPAPTRSSVGVQGAPRESPVGVGGLGRVAAAGGSEVGDGSGQSRRVLAAQRAEHDALFRAHYPTVVAFLACRIPVEDAVKDLGSEVFVQAWRQRDHVIVDEDRGWLPWLFTVARRMSNAWVAAQATAGARNARMAPPAPEDFMTRVVEVDAANQQLSAALAAMLRLGAAGSALQGGACDPCHCSAGRVGGISQVEAFLHLTSVVQEGQRVNRLMVRPSGVAQ